LKKVSRLKLGIITKPIAYLLISSSLALLAKKFNFRRLIANPLRDESLIAKNDKYWKYATLNGIIVGTVGFTAFAFYRSEANKVLLYKKYEKEIAEFMRWKTDRAMRVFLTKE
jgi:hypothetical protein